MRGAGRRGRRGISIDLFRGELPQPLVPGVPRFWSNEETSLALQEPNPQMPQASGAAGCRWWELVGLAKLAGDTETGQGAMGTTGLARRAMDRAQLHEGLIEV
jgi:hypothetical protein